jgi:hypothetical protein
MKDKYFHGAEKDSFFSFDYLKVCSEFTVNNNIPSMSDIGVLDDNTLVKDALACKSGFALYFNKNKETVTNILMSQFCIAVKGVEKDKDSRCVIRYTKGSEIEFIYDQNKVNPDLYKRNNFTDCDLIIPKIELFQDHLIAFKKIDCEKEQFYNEPFTCENDEP